MIEGHLEAISEQLARMPTRAYLCRRLLIARSAALCAVWLAPSAPCGPPAVERPRSGDLRRAPRPTAFAATELIPHALSHHHKTRECQR
jgi:hypothetical protein